MRSSSQTRAEGFTEAQAERVIQKAKSLVDILKENPWQNPPPYEKLVGDLNGFYSRRINVQHRLVYKVYEDEKVVAIYSMWTHYE